MELGLVAKYKHKSKRVIKRWRLDRFEDEEVKIRYQHSLMAEVDNFTESIKCSIEGGLKGHDLVNELLLKDEIKEKIKDRREL